MAVAVVKQPLMPDFPNAYYELVSEQGWRSPKRRIWVSTDRKKDADGETSFEEKIVNEWLRVRANAVGERKL